MNLMAIFSFSIGSVVLKQQEQQQIIGFYFNILVKCLTVLKIFNLVINSDVDACARGEDHVQEMDIIYNAPFKRSKVTWLGKLFP